MSYNCNICNKLFKSYQSLWNHNKLKHPELKIKVESGDKIFKCEYCGGLFSRKFNLEQTY